MYPIILYYFMRSKIQKTFFYDFDDQVKFKRDKIDRILKCERENHVFVL